MKNISDKTRFILQNAGWYEGRKIDSSSTIALLKSAGYYIFDELTTFLSEFGGLDLRFTNSLGIDLFVSFNIKWTLENSKLYEEDIIRDDYPKAINCNMLTIIGRKNTDTCLAINEKGIIYSLYDGYILEVGKGIEGIDNLISKSYKDLKQIPMPDWWGE